jgi:hypothetical protein
MAKKIIELLYRSFDDSLSDEEQNQLTRALSQSAELRKEREQILKLRGAFAGSHAHSFKPFFADRVMNQLKIAQSHKNEAETFFNSLVAVFKPVAIAVAIILFSLLTYNLKQTKNYTLAGALGEKKIMLEEIVDPIYTLTMEQ